MIRTLKHKEKEFIVVDTDFQVKDGDKIISVPFHLQINATDLNQEEYSKVLKKTSALFNHIIVVDLKKPEKLNKPTPWYKRIFN